MIVLALACGATQEASSPGASPTIDSPADHTPPAAEREPLPVQERFEQEEVVVAHGRGLCLDDEVVYFACPLERDRLVSLCGTAALRGQGAALRLRVGRTGSLEVHLPPAPEGSVDVFEGGVLEGAMAVRLSTGRLGFEVFQEGDMAGLTRVAPNGSRTDERCLAIPSGDLERVIQEVFSIPYWR